MDLWEEVYYLDLRVLQDLETVKDTSIDDLVCQAVLQVTVEVVHNGSGCILSQEGVCVVVGMCLGIFHLSLH